jgi:hypothetical protein
MSFSKTENRKNKTGPVWRLAPVGGAGYKERVKEGECGGILCSHV